MQRIVHYLFIVRLLEIFYGSFVFFELEMDHSDKKQDIRPLENGSAVVDEQLL